MGQETTSNHASCVRTHGRWEGKIGKVLSGATQWGDTWLESKEKATYDLTPGAGQKLEVGH